MNPAALAQSPFAVLTFIVAPAILTNASSVLVMSTINRMLRTRDRMHELFAKSQETRFPKHEEAYWNHQVNQVEKQGVTLLHALGGIYVSLGSFASATLVTLLGAVLISLGNTLWLNLLMELGLFLGFAGVTGLVFGSIKLFQATQISLSSIREEADLIRARQPIA